MLQIYKTGRGTFRLRARWRYVKEGNMIEIYEIPYTTATEIIMDKVAELIKAGKVREIADMRDETDLNGLKLTIDLKRGTDPEKLMQKLFKNDDAAGLVRLQLQHSDRRHAAWLGVREIFEEWTAWRCECVRRRVYFQLQKKKKDKLHLLKGLGKILLDIDKAIRIIRETELDAEVISNLMIGFGIDQVQAEYVAEIKLRNINKEFLLNRLQETESLEREIAELEELLGSEKKIKAVICKELDAVSSKYGQPRKTQLVYDHELNVSRRAGHAGLSGHGLYLPRGTISRKSRRSLFACPASRSSRKETRCFLSRETTNSAELLVFTDRCQVYKTRLSDFDDGKASQLGDYLPGKLGFDEGESFFDAIFPGDYSGNLLFVFENGKCAKVELSGYATKTNRRKPTGAYCDKSPLVSVIGLPQEEELALYASDGRTLIFSTALLAPKTTKPRRALRSWRSRKTQSWCASERLQTAPSAIRRYRAKSLPPRARFCGRRIRRSSKSHLIYNRRPAR